METNTATLPLLARGQVSTKGGSALMGSRGPSPKPTALKALHGTARRDRSNPSEPQPQVTAVSCPAFLDSAAKAEWRRLIPHLVKLKLMSDLDRGLLAAYCAAWSRWRKAELAIQKFGEVLATPSGYMQKNPHVTIANESIRTLEKLAGHFGLSPSTRTRVSATPEEQEDDPFDEWEQRRRSR